MLRLEFLWHFLGIISQCFVPVYPTPDVSHICGPDTNEELAQSIQNSQWLASDWLLDQKTSDWGWDFLSTGSAILSLHLANETWLDDGLDSLESQLTAKQLEIEVLRDISHKQHYREMSLGYLAYYAMALEATCQDASDFHGHSLVRQLRRRIELFRANETTNYFPYSLAVLALCSSGNDVPHQAIETLKTAQGNDGCFPLGVDVTSMAVMAMSCMKPLFNSVRQINALNSMIENGSQCIMGHQRDNGGFSNSLRTNIISSALAAQALIAAKVPPSQWSCEDVLLLILAAQHQEGHFGSQAGTIQILPLLSKRHHGSLSEIEQECPEGDLLEAIPFIGRHDKTITVHLEISQIEDDGTIVLFTTITVDALPGESLFRVMERARLLGYLRFESKMTQFGNFIFSINNIENDDANAHYWFISEVDENGNQVFAQTGPDGIFPSNNSVYYWVYRQYVPH